MSVEIDIPPRLDADSKAKSSTQIAIEIIKKLILENKLPAGSNHLESELAKRLGMSRTPIREATLILEAQGLLQVKPRRGVKILSFSTDDMNEIYQILTELEGLSAELAAKKQFKDEDFSTAEQAIADMDQALELDEREAWAIADEAFHNELIRLGGNRRVANIVEMYNDQVRRIRALTLYLRPSPTKSNDDHRNVLRAIRARDPETARSLHTAHRIQAGKILIELLQKFGFHQV
ncbi:GntR family transcriptional regulator [Pelagibius sp. Alg239-R121]|uniref:GntR family transcriptional regulator n=1 Tax=Pelagibius sp. Alg239-R121 TaxID=2993448 RepID=UPI0024A62123|nr:GntR family transcriptional regulator [Pelagibius sp. Alg239-R121]